MEQAHILAIFLAQLIVLMVVGRGLGEVMARHGQPAIFGQLLAGVALGPSLFGALLPDLRAVIFPDSDELRTMIDAISQVGILLLLLLTGMETNIQLVRRRFATVATTSVTGIAVPFALGLALGLLIPDSLVPDEGRRLVTALFIGTALSISSVKIVAMVLMEVGFIRRDLGQLILATAILDDSVAWIIVSVIAGMAARGNVEIMPILFSIAAAVVFLAISLTIGRRLVAVLIRWANDSLLIEFPVITAVLVVTFCMALITDLIGVHSALGAFIGGVLIGQAPILRGHIEQELRGLILAFFSPVFFAVAGLGMDLTTLASPFMLGLALVFVAIASIGKTAGALIGGRLAGLSGRESLALASGLNARGSTEVIIATIGMSLGVLSESLYTLIVAMAIITTMAMPPTLRWALSRVPMRDDERQRLEQEEAAEADQLTGMERVLVLVDDSANAEMALRLSGAFAVDRQILTTVLERRPSDTAAGAGDETRRSVARAAAEAVLRRRSEPKDGGGPVAASKLILGKEPVDGATAEEEAAKGYSILFAGLDTPIDPDGAHFSPQLAAFLNAVDIPVALTMAAGARGRRAPRSILVTTDGSRIAKLATEVAVALARAHGSKLAILNVIEQAPQSYIRHQFDPNPEHSVLNQADAMARRYGVVPTLREVSDRDPHRVITRFAASRDYDLVVLGAALRQDSGKFLGPRTRSLLHSVRLPKLLILR